MKRINKTDSVRRGHQVSLEQVVELELELRLNPDQTIIVVEIRLINLKRVIDVM